MSIFFGTTTARHCKYLSSKLSTLIVVDTYWHYCINIINLKFVLFLYDVQKLQKLSSTANRLLPPVVCFREVNNKKLN